MPAASTGLARVTVSSPQRRVDVALPDGVPLAELLPEILRRAGEGLADDGQRHGGWLLRRADGTPLSPSAGLASQDVHDGAVLNLVPARLEWPELEYDDVVEAIAAAARRGSAGWSPRVSRAAGLAVAAAIHAVALVAVLRGGPPWSVPAAVALGIAALSTLTGVVASRAYGDAVVGAALASYALPYALVGGVLAVLPARSLGSLGPDVLGSGLLTGTVMLLLWSVVGAVGIGHGLRVFVAGAAVGLLGTGAVVLAYALPAASVAALVMTLLVTGVPAVPLLALRLGKLPMPVLALPAELPAGGGALAPAPDGARVFAAVARTDEMLTGMVIGLGVAAVACSLVLVRSGGTAGRLLVAVCAVSLLLRARVFATVRHRLPMLAAGVAAFGALAAGAVPGRGVELDAVAVGAGVSALVVAAAGARYAGRAPSPYLGRAADVLDALCLVSVVPVACAVIGLYALVRGLAG